jgi:ATP-dependent RNA helicase HelY
VAWFPSLKLRQRWMDVQRIATELNAIEEDAGLPLTRPPDPGFVSLAFGWASGGDLDDVIADEDLSGGDFVRNVKQLIDLLRQLALVAERPSTRKAAGAAADALFRGVVAASSVVTTAAANQP